MHSHDQDIAEDDISSSFLGKHCCIILGEITMARPEFIVPLTPQDLPAEETYEMINASFDALQRATDGVFARIQTAVEERKGK